MPLTEKQKTYCVYKHTNKENGKVYIGITRQPPDRRWQNGHGYDGTYFGNAIQKHGWDGFAHDILFAGLSEGEACRIEKELIAAYDSQNREHGYNICEGGQTGDNLHPMKGTDNYRAVAVKRIDPRTGETVTYSTMNTAARAMSINYRGICKACRGIISTYQGYVWEYADVAFIKPVHPGPGNYPHTAQRKRIAMADNGGKGSITYFESIKEAAKQTGLRPCTISRYLTGTRRDPAGRGWSYCL